MRKLFKRAAALATTVATVGTMLLPVAPVHAADLTSTKDTLSREKISVTSVTHTLVTTLPTVSTGTVIRFLYDTAGFTSTAQSTSAGTCATGTCTLTVSATDVKINCTAGPCSGLFTQTGTFTATNPGTAGSKEVTYAQAQGDPVSGSFAIPIVDDDQVTVTATVAPSITFDIDTAQTDTESAAPYSVALGAITTTDSQVSGATDAANFIWMNLDTNATGGAVITVLSANGANGLVSTAVSADDIDSASALIANGTENYGICVSSTSATTGSFTEVSPFDNADCTADEQTPSVGGLTTSAQNLVNTGGNPISVGRVQVTVAAAISAITEAHNDYTDTLTFIATGTF
ncbi:MAG: hypothetical protein AAB554_05165 [Patescibacteria group bacterium]